MSKATFKGKVILVTGGTGSFGNFVVRRLMEHEPKEIRVFSRDEKKQYDMRVFYRAYKNLTFVIGDVRNYESINEAMQGVDSVFHAAALKQVPTCEHFPMEAVRTNILGVNNVVQAALSSQVKTVVAISTDKAVKPVNVMGMTKALQERIVLEGNLSKLNRGTRLACVRYGNVLRSRGSVVPFFRRQLSLGQKLTITDERMTRFLLTLNDAIDLVFHASEHTLGGEVFVRKAPSGRVVDLASLISEEYKVPFHYEVIGMLPGEKINEILISEEEMIRTEDMGQYYRILPWWDKRQPSALQAEYCSLDSLVDQGVLKGLIARCDAEYKAMEIVNGEFAQF